MLGNAYLMGEGVSKNEKRAKELFRKACQAGLKEACS